MNKTPEEILKETYNHHRTVVNPDGNWASWESCVEDGSMQVGIDAINAYHNQFVQDTVSNCQGILDSSIQQEQQDWISLDEYKKIVFEKLGDKPVIKLLRESPKVPPFKDWSKNIHDLIDKELNATREVRIKINKDNNINK